MRSYKDLSINTKLSLLVLLASGVALFLATLCFVANDVSMIRSSMIRQMTALAGVLGSNTTAALNFQDPDSAKELLNSLHQQPSIEFACIYDARGQIFTTYERGDMKDRIPASPPELGYRFAEGGYMDVVESIYHNGQRIGTIYLHASPDELYQQIVRYVAIVAGMVTVAMGCSFLLAWRFQRVISSPILQLAEAAKRISMERNYGIRVAKSADDELGTLYDQFNAMLEQIQKGEAAIQRAHDELELKVQNRTSELSRANADLSREVSVRLRAEQELEATHQKLMDAARRAGMAEIATGVLHNVGNVLNSLNVSATLVADRARQSKVTDLVRATQLIEQHAADLATFITQDPQGKQLPAFLSLLATHLSDERAEIADELDLLTQKVEHIKTIVSTQQSYTGVSGVLEEVDLATTLDDAMRLDTASFDRHRIKVVKEYQEIPKVLLDKQRILQILVNLIKNAKDALRESGNPESRRITVRTMISAERRLQIQISDNGMGIAQQDMTRIFSHGFTTKKTGHGFGLHSCANAAAELGGSVRAESDGPGKGATFILEVPFRPVEHSVGA